MKRPRPQSEDRPPRTQKRQSQRTEIVRRNSSLPNFSSQSILDIDCDYLCDQTVIFEGTNTVRNVIGMELAEKSLFFERLLRYHIQHDPISLPGEYQLGFPEVLRYIRTGKADFSKANVLHMFKVADYMLLLELRSVCINIITQYMKDTSFAYDVWKETKHLYWPDIGSAAFIKLVENFETFRQQKIFRTLFINEVKEILSCDFLNVRTESSVFQAIVNWLKGSRNDNEITEIFYTCRFGLMNSLEMDEVKLNLPNNLLLECSEFLLNFPTSLQDATKNELIKNWNGKLSLPRLPYEAIFVFGGWCEGLGPKSAVQVYDIRAHEWTLWPNEANSHENPLSGIPRRVYAGCIVVDDKVYLIGGFDGSDALKSTLCFDFSTNSSWYEASCMYEKRYYVSVAYCDGHIYALGGHNGENRGRLNSAEKYGIHDNTWRPIQPMHTIRSDASATALHSKVYVCGGFDGRVYHASAECYNAKTDSWTMIISMSSPRGGVAVISYKDWIYAVGGNNGTSRLNTLERYDVNRGTWENCGEMLHKKSNLSLSIVEDNLYIIGGWSDEPETGIMQTVERFDLQTGQCFVSTPMCFPASATCSCTVRIGYEKLQAHICRRQAMEVITDQM